MGASGNYAMAHEAFKDDNTSFLNYMHGLLSMHTRENNIIDTTDLLEIFMIILDKSEYLNVIQDKLSKMIPQDIILYQYIMEYLKTKIQHIRDEINKII
jgi:ABC-type multidrug transport system permease subunit